MSGPQPSIDMLRGAQLAAAQIDKRGAVEGTHITVIRVDDRANPTPGIKVAHTALSRGIVGVIRRFNSSVGVKTLSIYRGAGITCRW